MNDLSQGVLGLFLYFPEDKSEYIPAGITCVIFLVAAVFAMRFIIKISRNEALKTQELEDKITKQNLKISEEDTSQ